MLLVHFLFILYMLVFVIFSSSWCRGLAAVCDCGTPWTFLLTFLKCILTFSMNEYRNRKMVARFL